MRRTFGCLVLTTLTFLAPTVEVSAFGTQAPKAKPAKLDAFGDPLPDGVFYRLGTVRMRHEHTRALFFSVDGSQLLSQGSPDLRVWDVATGRIVQQIASAQVGTHLIASRDDRYLACIRGNSYQMLLLDKATGKELAQSDSAINCLTLAFSRDSKELIALTGEKTIVKWDIAQRKEIARIKLDTSKVEFDGFGSHCWHLAPDGATVAFMPGVAKDAPRMPWHFWDTATGKQCRPPIKSKVSPSQMCWSPDGRLIAVLASDNTAEVWDTVANKRLPLTAGNRQEEGTSHITRGVAFHPNGKLLAIAIDGSVGIWDVGAGKQLWGKQLSGELLVFSPDGKTLAVGGSGIIWLLETATGEPVHFSRRDPGWISLAHGWWGHTPSFSRQSRSFMVHDETGLSELETATGKRLCCFHSRPAIWSSAGLCGDGSLYSCVGGDAQGKAHVFMFDAATGKELWRRPKQPSAMHFTADGKKVAVMSWDGDEYTMLNAATGKEIQKLPIPSYRHDGNTLMAVSDDLYLAASARSWRNIELWELATGKKVRTLECPSHWTNGSLYFVPGNQLIVGAPDRYFIHREKKGIWGRVWEVSTGRIRQSFEEPILKMSDDGRWLALQGDKGIVVRHLQTGRLMAALSGVPADSGAQPMGFSADGSLLAIRHSSWHELGLWDTFTGRQVCRWVDPMSMFQWLACSPDSRTLVLAVRTGGSMLVCDVTGMATEPGKLPALRLTPAEADRYWTELTSDDGPRSQRARWSLVAGGEITVKMLQRSLRRVEPLDEKIVSALIAGLDSGSFKERQRSLQTLEKMELARTALKDAHQRNPSLEVKRRIELILAKLDSLPWDVEIQRAMRGVLLLEQIGTPPARQHLQSLASGAAASLLTQEAQAALQRLAQADGTR